MEVATRSHTKIQHTSSRSLRQYIGLIDIATVAGTKSTEVPAAAVGTWSSVAEAEEEQEEEMVWNVYLSLLLS